MQTFISIHDQDLILKSEENKIFRYLSDYKYLFLGFNPVDKLEHLKNKIIIARELPDNIENQKQLLDFTGWYAISRNNLYKDRHFIIVHYDCLIYKNFEKEIKKAFNENPDYLISFQPHSITKSIEDKFTKTLFRAIKEIYNIDSIELINEGVKSEKVDYPAGGSFAATKEWLDAFVDWMGKICPILISDPFAAMGTERAMKIFDLTNNVEEKYLPSIMKHIYNLAHDQVYAPEELLKVRREDFKHFLNGEMHNYFTTAKINKEYMKILSFTIEQLLLKF